MAVLVAVVVGAMAVAAAGMTTSAPTEPKRCCFDKQFAVTMGEIGAKMEPGEDIGFLDGGVIVGYDFYRKLEGIVTILRNQDEPGNFTTRYRLMNYDQMVQYEQLEKNGTCTKTTIDPHQHIFPPCIPDPAYYLGSATMGYGSSSMDVDSWELDMSNPGGHYAFKISVTKYGCVPVAQAMVGFRNGTFRDVSYFMTNYTPGLGKVNLLQIPDECVGL